MLVDASGNEVVSAGDAAPSMERGLQLLYEIVTAGPESVGLAFAGKGYAQRKLVLEDLGELMMFAREVWSGLSNYNLANPATDTPSPEEGK